MILMNHTVLIFTFCVFLSIINFSTSEEEEAGYDEGEYDYEGEDPRAEMAGWQEFLDKVERARLAQQAGRYGTMAKAMKQAAEKAIQNGIRLYANEQYLIEYSYKIIADARRSAINLLFSREKEGNPSESYLRILKQLKDEVFREQQIICQDVLKLMELLLEEEKKYSDKNEDTLIFYYTMRGDYHRYMSEVKSRDEIQVEAKKSLDNYKAAYEIAEKYLRPFDAILLGLVTKLTVLYQEVYFAPLEAYKIAEKAIKKVDEETQGNFDELTPEEKANYDLIKTNKEKFLQYADQLKKQQGGQSQGKQDPDVEDLDLM